MTSARDVLAMPDFRRLWGAQLVAFFGDSLTMFGLLFLVQRAVGEATSVAGILIAAALPSLVVGVVAGVWVDRWNRKTVMIWSDLLRAGLVLAIPLLGTDHLWPLYLLVFVHASIGTFFAPARAALVPAVVGPDALPAANGLGESTRPVATVLGTAVAGVLVGVFDDFVLVFAINAVTFLVSAAFVGRVAHPGAVAPPSAGDSRSVVGELAMGLLTVRRSRTLVGVFVGAAVAMFGLGATNAIMVPFVVGDLGLSETWFGLLEGAQTVSLVVSGLMLGWLATKVGMRRLVPIGLAGLGVAVAAISQVTSVAGMALLMFCLGFAVAPVMAGTSTLFQQHTPTHLLGRVAASLNAVVTAASVASMALAASLVAVLGVRGVFVASGAVCLVAASASAWLLAGGEAQFEPEPAPGT